MAPCVGAHEPTIADYKFHGGILGQGSFATVRLARHVDTGAKVAVKCVEIGASDIKALENEARHHMQLTHPHIVELLEAFEDEGMHVLVMEYVSGVDLGEYISCHGKLDEFESARLFRQMVSAVGYCHSCSVVHRDIKPENILTDSELDLKLTDFGLSADISCGELLTEQVGSLHYAAPELLRHTCSYRGPEVDVWSCGVVLYCLLCGRLPFDNDRVETLIAAIQAGTYQAHGHLSEDAVDILARLLTVDTSQRATIPQIQGHWWLYELSETKDCSTSSPSPRCHACADSGQERPLLCELRMIPSLPSSDDEGEHPYGVSSAWTSAIWRQRCAQDEQCEMQLKMLPNDVSLNNVYGQRKCTGA